MFKLRFQVSNYVLKIKFDFTSCSMLYLWYQSQNLAKHWQLLNFDYNRWLIEMTCPIIFDDRLWKSHNRTTLVTSTPPPPQYLEMGGFWLPVFTLLTGYGSFRPITKSAHVNFGLLQFRPIKFVNPNINSAKKIIHVYYWEHVSIKLIELYWERNLKIDWLYKLLKTRTVRTHIDWYQFSK